MIQIIIAAFCFILCSIMALTEKDWYFVGFCTIVNLLLSIEIRLRKLYDKK